MEEEGMAEPEPTKKSKKLTAFPRFALCQCFICMI